MLCYTNNEVLLVLSKHVGICDSNEAEALAISESVKIFFSSFQGMLMLESESLILWVGVKEQNKALEISILF